MTPSSLPRGTSWISPPATVRGRLLFLMIVAAIPVSCMAGFIAWQNYRIAASQADNAVLIAQESALARYDMTLLRVRHLLERAAADPAMLSTDGCNPAEMARLVTQWDGLVSTLAIVSAEGRALCSAGEGRDAGAGAATSPSALAEVVRHAASGSGFRVAGPASAGGPGSPDLFAVLPLGAPAAPAGMLVAGLRADFLASADAADLHATRLAWLTDAHGLILRQAGALTPPPPDDILLATASSTRPVVAKRRDGELLEYVGQPLAPDLRLVVATTAGRDVSGARGLLARRAVELCVLVLAGVGLIAIGAKVAVVDPLNALTDAVRLWRAGGAFTPALLGGPVELVELGHSFQQALASVAEQERLLREAATRQELLMQEIHHRVKNNLQIIASLLNLQASRIRAPEARAEFQSARDRIRALATLHRHLYAYGELHTINMRGFLTELCGQLLQALGEAPPGGRTGRIHLDIEAVDLQISSDQAVPMALIVTETVSNAAKYAFPSGRQGTIHIRLTTEGETVRLTIEDNGVGIPAGRGETEAGVRDGIGIHLIRGFARQLGAELVVTEDHGTRYDLTLKMRREAAARVAASALGAPAGV